MVGEVRRQAAVVEARELLGHQAGQELGLGELLGAELMPARGEGLTGGLVGDLEHPARGFAGLHTSYYARAPAGVRGFLQSRFASNRREPFKCFALQ